MSTLEPNEGELIREGTWLFPIWQEYILGKCFVACGVRRALPDHELRRHLPNDHYVDEGYLRAMIATQATERSEGLLSFGGSDFDNSNACFERIETGTSEGLPPAMTVRLCWDHPAHDWKRETLPSHRELGDRLTPLYSRVIIPDRAYEAHLPTHW